LLKPIDGLSLKPLFTTDLKERARPMGFRHTGRAAFIDNRYKLVALNTETGPFELYDIIADPQEKKDLAAEKPEIAARMRAALQSWNESVKASVEGKDYPEGRVDPKEPPTRHWMTSPEYAPYLKELQKRPEYSTPPAAKKKGKKSAPD
jgi:arylsulfatase A-like enzyme